MKNAILINQKESTKNILFLISSIGGGGAERVACRLVSEFSKRHKVYLLYFDKKEKEYSVSPKVKLIPFITTNKPPKRDKNGKQISQKVLRMNKVEEVRRMYKIDVTISFLRWPNVFNVNAGGGTKRILSERNDPEGKGEEYFESMKSAYEKGDKIVFQTKYVRNKFPDSIRKKGIIIPNPVSVTCLADPTITEKKIVSVGRLVPQKNQAVLIKAFSIFEKTHKGYHLYIYGEGSLLNELKTLSIQKNVKDKVHFEGFCKDVHEKIKDAEQFVLSSDFEGMPNALMEAMMMGIPCISTNCSGLSELIFSGVNGLLVPIKDVSALARAMCMLSDDKVLQNKLRRAAKIKSEEWKTQRIIKKWEELF